MSDHEVEYVRGLPEALPAGERILWQGTPEWRALARRVFHVRGLTLYFALLLVWRAVSVLWSGGSVEQSAIAVMWLAPFAAAAVGLLLLVAWLMARAAVYTITNRRVVMRIGVVLEITVNYPFRLIESAGLRIYPDGSGDIPISLTGEDRIAYIHLWPHARPWRAARPEPMLRGVPDAAHAADILSRALAAYAGVSPKRVAAASNDIVGDDKDAGARGEMGNARPLATASR